MKNLLTLLFLVISVLAFGQSNSQSLEVEIKYWKSIAESNDTVAYREYLNRYGENGLYYDEALTRIALLKTSGKQTQSNNTECCFYSQHGPYNAKYVVRFDAEQSKKIWLKLIDYYKVRDNLTVSRDYYENQAAVAMSCDLYEKVKKSPIFGKITDNNMGTLSGATIIATHTPSGIKYRTGSDANGNYCLVNIRPGGPYKIEFRMNNFRSVVIKGITVTLSETKIINAVLDKKSIGQVEVEADTIPHHKNVWTTDEEYQYDPIKSTAARDVYFKRDNLYKISYRIIKRSGREYINTISFYVYDDEYRINKENYRHSDNENYVHEDYSVKTMKGFRYVAFSKDKSSFIMWFEEDDNLDGVILEKTEYKRVPKEELLPKAVNYDFLNE